MDCLGSRPAGMLAVWLGGQRRRATQARPGRPMAGSPKLGNPGPLAPPPSAWVWSWSQLEEEPTLASGSIEATARASDATIVPSLEASTQYQRIISKLFYWKSPLWQLSLPNHTLFTNDHIDLAGEPYIQRSLRNRLLSLPQTVKHQPGARTTRPNRRHELYNTRHHLQRNSTLVS